MKVGGGGMNSREDADLRLRRIRNMRETDKVAYLLEMIVDLLLDIRFGDKKT